MSQNPLLTSHHYALAHCSGSHGAHASATTLTLTVTNSGVEIPATEYDNIFEKFYRIPNGDPWRHGGTGLGLALVKKRVLYLGGTVQVAAAADTTQFTLRLPLRYDPPLSLVHPRSTLQTPLPQVV